MHVSAQPERNQAVEALASIPIGVVNLLGDARVTHIAIGRGGAWIGSFGRSFEPPLRVEDALTFASAYTGGLRAICMDLTTSGCLWLGARFRFAFLESPQDAAARRDALRAEGERPPRPHVRAFKK